MNRYPRNMTGYGATPPDPEWPGGARITVQIVLNYEEGGENCLLHGDPASEAFLSEIVGAGAWPGQRHWNMESIYEYGARAGFWRLYRLLKDMPVTVYGVATALARAPEQVAAMKAAPWEIASHGLKWIEYKDMPEDEERAQMQEAIRLHTEVTGTRPRGWYTGRCSMNTARLAAEEGGFAYVADSYADDLPYWQTFGDHTQLIIPYTLDSNDMRFATPQGFNAGDQFETYLKDSFDVLYEEGCPQVAQSAVGQEAGPQVAQSASGQETDPQVAQSASGQPKMLSIGLHCRLMGRPGRIAALKRVIDYMAGHDHVWFATREQIADHWATTHPPVSSVAPSEMDRTTFIDTFGGIFEHSPWIAEAAYDLELGPTHDTARGVHSALARIFRTASHDQRMDVLKAHPDLAGKLAQARRLTAESSAEQASAGLDALTDDERKRFTDLNTAYVAKMGFPFIIAVRDHTKASILQAFETRLDHDRDTEFAEACRQVERIAELRLIETLAS